MCARGCVLACVGVGVFVRACMIERSHRVKERRKRECVWEVEREDWNNSH